MRTAALLTAVGLALAVAACGSSSKPRGEAAATSSKAGAAASRGGLAAGSQSVLAFSKCMRANGLPEFPDLSSDGLLIGQHGQTLSVNGVSVNAAAFAAALPKCERYRPHTSSSPAQTARQIRQGLQFARCMRGHGVSNFPDPRTVTGAGGNQQAYLPGVNLESPAVGAAAKACGGGPKGP